MNAPDPPAVGILHMYPSDRPKWLFRITSIAHISGNAAQS
jgi:hypothetical protein